MMEDWLRTAHDYCSTQYKWPFSEVRDQTTSWAGEEEVDYSSFDVEFKADSIRILLIGGERMEKLRFEEYLKMREEQPDANDRVFSDFGRVLRINPIADVSGTIAAFGQYAPALDPTDDTATTIFSPYDKEGNEALVEKMTSFLKRREHLPDEAELHDQRADDKLQRVWVKVQAEQYNYKSRPGSEGLWKRIDGGYREDRFNTNQF
jgi:hypothetical protein